MKPVRSAKYLAWIREFNCVVCDAPPPNHPHHYAGRSGVGGMGEKTDDYRTVPLCWRCHRKIHDYGIDKFEEKTTFGHAELQEIQLKFLVFWANQLEEREKHG